jgi:hypothetical protein
MPGIIAQRGGKVRNAGRTGPPDDGDCFEVLPDGEVVEK